MHQRSSIPATLLDATFSQAYPTKRVRSIWIGIVGRTLPSFLMITVLLPLVFE